MACTIWGKAGSAGDIESDDTNFMNFRLLQQLGLEIHSLLKKEADLYKYNNDGPTSGWRPESVFRWQAGLARTILRGDVKVDGLDTVHPL
jgi:hypothetical protein